MRRRWVAGGSRVGCRWVATRVSRSVPAVTALGALEEPSWGPLGAAVGPLRALGRDVKGPKAQDGSKRAPKSVTRERLRVTALGSFLEPSWALLGPSEGPGKGPRGSIRPGKGLFSDVTGTDGSRADGEAGWSRGGRRCCARPPASSLLSAIVGCYVIAKISPRKLIHKFSA